MNQQLSHRHCGVLAAWLFAVITVTAQSPATTSGSITGRVTNESGQPLANARVIIYAVGFRQRNSGALTDREGKFQIDGLEPRSYQIITTLSPYALFISTTTYRAGDSVSIVLTKGGVITGTVTTQTGEPLVGVLVQARMVGSGDKNRLTFLPGFFSLSRPTDDRGVYRLYGLRAGTYVVWAGGSGDHNSDADVFNDVVPTYSPASTRDSAAEISVSAGEEVSNVDIRFRGGPGHTISGRLIQPGSAKQSSFVINLTAVARNKSEWTMNTAQPDSSQSFTFRGVDDGEYEVTALSYLREGLSGMVATKRIKVSGSDVTGIELTTESLASVSGRIVLEEANKTECAGKQRPLFSETLVSAAQDESQAVEFYPQLEFFLKSPATVDADGNLLMKNLAPGRYFFTPEFAAKYWYLQSITFPKTTRTPPVDATRAWTTLKSGEQLSGLTITLAQGAASLTGQVKDMGSEDLFFYLVPAEKERAEDVLSFFGAAIGSDGKVGLNSLPPGRYWVLVKAAAEGASTVELRRPDRKELRASLRREAEAAKTAIDLKPCQHLTGLSLKPNQ